LVARIAWTDTVSPSGLQTPRLKRLAEIVSAQAIAQQEKLEYTNGDDYEVRNELAEVDEMGEEQ
jgi:myosin V